MLWPLGATGFVWRVLSSRFPDGAAAQNGTGKEEREPEDTDRRPSCKATPLDNRRPPRRVKRETGPLVPFEVGEPQVLRRFSILPPQSYDPVLDRRVERCARRSHSTRRSPLMTNPRPPWVGKEECHD